MEFARVELLQIWLLNYSHVELSRSAFAFGFGVVDHEGAGWPERVQLIPSIRRIKSTLPPMHNRSDPVYYFNPVHLGTGSAIPLPLYTAWTISVVQFSPTIRTMMYRGWFSILIAFIYVLFKQQIQILIHIWNILSTLYIIYYIFLILIKVCSKSTLMTELVHTYILIFNIYLFMRVITIFILHNIFGETFFIFQ